MRRLGVPGAALALLAGLAGCTSADDGPERATAPELPDLEQVWRSPIRGGDGAWELADALVVADGRRLAALDAASGKRRWQLALPGKPCRWSEEASDDGRLAVLLHSGNGSGPCRDVALVDLRHGRVDWRVEVEHPSAADYAPATFDVVSTGERAVAVTDSVLDGAVRLAVDDGRVLSTLADDRARGITSDGDHLFTIDISRSSDARITVLDQDDGRRVASYAAEDSYELHPVLREPMVLGADRGHGGSYLFATPGGMPIGRGLPAYAAASGDRLASVYGDALVVSDLTTGEEVAAAPLAGVISVLGIEDDGLITHTTPLPGAPEPTSTLQRVDLADPADPVVLGSLAGSPIAMIGDTVYTAADDGITAFELPADGPVLSSFLDALPWDAGDLRPTDVFDACLAVSDDTRRLAGADPAGRVVGSCEWGSGERLTVSVEAMLPAGEDSAVREAEEVLEYAADAAEPEDVGDGAYLETGRAATLTARHGNVIIRVSATHFDLGDDSPRPRRAVLAAADEVIAELERRAED